MKAVFPFLLFLGIVTFIPNGILAVSPETQMLCRSKVWVNTWGGGIVTNREKLLGFEGDSYPGFFAGYRNQLTQEKSTFSILGVYKNQPFSWGVLMMNYSNSMDVISQGTLTNYNFKKYGVGVAEEEIWCSAKLTGDSPSIAADPINADITYKARSHVWSLPKYDDFVITEFTFINNGIEPIYNFYVIELKGMFITYAGRYGRSNENRPDDEYIWDDSRGIFIFYDAEEISDATGERIPWEISPGDVTGDVGDPGNINVVGSIDFQLYAPQTMAFSYVNITSGVEMQYSIAGNRRRHLGEGTRSQVWEQTNAIPGNTGQCLSWPEVLWLHQPDAADPTSPISDIFKYPNPKMSWKEANAIGEQYAGNLDERAGSCEIIGIGPFTLNSQDSVTMTRIWCYGDMERSISMRGGLEATKKLDLDFASTEEGAANEHASIKNLRENWDAALELINNNYVPTEVPPPTCGIPPRVTFNPNIYSDIGNVLEVTQYVGEMTGRLEGAESAIQITWDAVHENYVDPIKGTDDFTGYYVYQSDVGIEGPWTRIATVSKSEAAAATSGGRVSMAFPVKAGVPYRYTVTSYDTDGNESGRTCYNYEAYTTKRSATNDFSKVRVVPNPFKQRSGFLDPAEAKRLTFVNTPSICTVKIYNLAGELIRTIEHNDGTGEEAWGSNIGTGDYMLSEYFSNIMPGLYIYHIQSHVAGHEDETAVGKFVIIK